MAEMGEIVDVKVLAVHPRYMAEGSRLRGGYCTVSCIWGMYNLMDDSAQGVHLEDRRVGATGRLKWTETPGGYNGPVWVRNEEEDNAEGT